MLNVKFWGFHDLVYFLRNQTRKTHNIDEKKAVKTTQQNYTITKSDHKKKSHT